MAFHRLSCLLSQKSMCGQMVESVSIPVSAIVWVRKNLLERIWSLIITYFRETAAITVSSVSVEIFHFTAS